MLSYVLVVVLGAIVGGGLCGGAWWWLNRQSAEVESAPSDAERTTRHQLRNQIGDLIQRGRIHQMNMLSISQGFMPEPEKFVGQLVREVANWHFEVIRFAEINISHADAMRVSVPPPSAQYSDRFVHNYTEKDGKSYGGWDLRTTWDSVVGDLASLERFLTDLPELTKTSPPSINIQQTNPLNSPNVIGNNNQISVGGVPPLTQRRLTEAEKRAMLAVLKDAPPASIFLPVWDSRESRSYLSDFTGVLAQVGWKFGHFPTGDRPEPIGAVYVSGTPAPNPSFDALVKALTAAGIRFKAEEGEFNDGAGGRFTVLLDVGVVPATHEQSVFDRGR